MKILVTGGAGFAGSHLIEELIQQGFPDIYSTSFSTPNKASLILSQDRYIQVDLTDIEATATLIQELQPDWIFHLASFAYVGKSFEKAEELFSNNIQLQLSLLEAVRLHSPQSRVLTIGSAEEYGIVPDGLGPIDESFPLNPVNPYAVSKVTQDLLANSYFLSYGLNIVRARPFNHIGIRQTGDFAIPAFAKQIVAIERKEQQELKVGNLTGIRDFTAVKDMVRAYIVLMQKGIQGEVYNIGTGKGTKMSDVVEILTSLSIETIEVKEDLSRMRPLDVSVLIADNEKIRALGWEPREDLKETLAQVIEYWRAQSKE